MVEIIIGYLIFCLTTLIVFLWSVILPTVTQVYAIEDPVPKVVELSSKYTSIIVLSIMVLLFAPIIFIVYLSPAYSARFKYGLFQELSKPSEK